MLSFEETGQMNSIGGLAIRPSAGFVPGGGGTDERFAAGNAFRRIRVEDKRIINSKADVNQLVPFKYKWRGRSTWRRAPITGCRRKST
jgi:hypothetical protein